MTKGRKQETKIYKRSFENPQVVGLVGDFGGWGINVSECLLHLANILPYPNFNE